MTRLRDEKFRIHKHKRRRNTLLLLQLLLKDPVSALQSKELLYVQTALIKDYIYHEQADFWVGFMSVAVSLSWLLDD